MARTSIRILEAALEAKSVEADGLRTELASLQARLKHDYIERAEYNRVQALLRTTQQFCRKYKDEARPAANQAPVSAKRAAMEAAKAEALATGRAVAVRYD